MISAISWVSELITVAGGEDIFADRSKGGLAKERFVNSEAVLSANPEVMLASWCGKPFDEATILRAALAIEDAAGRFPVPYRWWESVSQAAPMEKAEGNRK